MTKQYFFRSNNAMDLMLGAMMISTSKGLNYAKRLAKMKFKEYGYVGKVCSVKPFSIAVVALLLTLSLNVNAANNDTLKVDNNAITKVIEAPTTNSKGKATTKYYFIYKGELVNTSKTVVTKYKLAKQYNANCALALVVSRTNKRIILN